MTPNQSLSGNASDQFWKPYPTLAAARAWTVQLVGDMQLKLADLQAELPTVKCVVLSGSLARLDASPQSDVDLIVVLRDEALGDEERASNAVSVVWQRLESLGLREPQGGGVFAKPTSRQQLCDGPRGVVAENVDIFGKRIQLLLEARPIFGGEECMQLQRDILQRYADHPFAHRADELWGYLTDDLIRYWRSYRVWRQWDIKTGNGGWYLRNLKLRHSRLVTYAALLLACVADTIEKPSVESLLELLRLPPLERLHYVDQQLGVGAVAAVCQYYDSFLHQINDAAHRNAFEDATPSTPQQALDEADEQFAHLLDNSDQLRTALVRLILAVPNEHGDRILASLVF